MFTFRTPTSQRFSDIISSGSAFTQRFMLQVRTFMVLAGKYAYFCFSDGKTTMSSNICVAILHTPFLLMLLGTLLMIGLVLASAPYVMTSAVYPSPMTSNDCSSKSAKPSFWPDQILPYFVTDR